jgi:hypothetical protein
VRSKIAGKQPAEVLRSPSNENRLTLDAVIEHVPSPLVAAAKARSSTELNGFWIPDQSSDSICS